MIGRRRAIRVIGVGILCLFWPASLRASSMNPVIEALLKSTGLLYIATERRNGERSRKSPVWFFYEDGKIFFTTSPKSWKARRIASGSPLYINVGQEDGPALIGRATPVTESAVIDRMGEAYAKKYLIARLGLFRPRSSRVKAGKTRAYWVEVREERR